MIFSKLTITASVALSIVGTSAARAQVGPCYSAEQCRAMRYNYDLVLQQQREVAVQQARQAAIDLQNQQRAEAQTGADRIETENRIRQAAIDAEAAQLAAENSPDNKCHDPVVAGILIADFNNLAKDANTPSAVDIEHLTTKRYDSSDIFVCRGIFVLTIGTRLPGVISSRLNVANDPIISFSVSAFYMQLDPTK